MTDKTDTGDPAIVARLVAIAETATDDDGAWLAVLLADPLARTATAADLLTAAARLRPRDLTP